MAGRKKDPSPTSFEERLARAQAAHRKRTAPRRSSKSSLGIGMQMSVEMVAGVVAGGLIGWGLDRWLETAPWLLILFTLLGFAAGMRNVLRVAEKMGDEDAAHGDDGADDGASRPDA